MKDIYFSCRNNYVILSMMQDEIAEKEGLYCTASLPRSLLSGPLNYMLPKDNYLPTNKRRS